MNNRNTAVRRPERVLEPSGFGLLMSRMGLLRQTGARGVVIELRPPAGSHNVKARVGPADIGRPPRLSSGTAGGSPARRVRPSRLRRRRAAASFYVVLALSLGLYVAALMLDAWTALLLVGASGALALASGLACSQGTRSSPRASELRMIGRPQAQRTS